MKLNSINVKIDNYKKTSTINFQANPPLARKNKISTQKAVAAGAGFLTLVGSTVALIKHKGDISTFLKTTKSYFSKNQLINLNNSRDLKFPKLTNEDKFLKNLIPSTNPHRLVKDKKLVRVSFPDNGYIVYGPDSKGKQEFFDWTLEQFKKNNVDVIEIGTGDRTKQTNFDIQTKFRQICEDRTPEKFQQDEKFTAVVVRKLDKVGYEFDPKNPTKLIYGDYGNVHQEYSNGRIMTNGPETNEIVKKRGIILAYEANNLDYIAPDSIRIGRVDSRFNITPKEDEPIELWKEYTDDLRNSLLEPLCSVRKIKELERVKELFTKNGRLNELAPHLEYSVPYKYPLFTDPIKKFDDYFAKTSKDVSENNKYNYMINLFKEIYLDNLYFPINRHGERSPKIDKMMEKFDVLVEKSKVCIEPEYWKNYKAAIASIKDDTIDCVR